MRIIKILESVTVITVLALSVNSCGIYGRYKSDTQTANLQEYTTPSYKEIFSDTTLLGLIDTALSHNYDLLMSHERVAQAEAMLTAAKLAYLPRLSLGGSPAVVPDFGKKASLFTYTAGTASWEIDIFGRLTNAKRIANATRDEMLDLEQACRTELVAAVATTYYNLRMLEAQITATDAAEKNWKESVEAMKEMKEAGLEDEAGVSQFEGSYYSTRTTGKSLRKMKISAINSLKLLLCCDSLKLDINPIDGNTVNDINMSAIDTIRLDAVRVRPDVKAAEMQLAGAFYNVNLARANCCPSISLGGTVGWSNGNLMFTAIGNLLQPIFNAGENIAGLRVSKSRYEEYKMSYAKALMTAGTEVNDAIAGISTHRSLIEDYSKNVEAMSRALEATQLKLKYGRGTYLEVLMAQNSLLEAQIGESGNYSDLLASAIKLYQALGGGK